MYHRLPKNRYLNSNYRLSRMCKCLFFFLIQSGEFGEVLYVYINPRSNEDQPKESQFGRKLLMAKTKIESLKNNIKKKNTTISRLRKKVATLEKQKNKERDQTTGSSLSVRPCTSLFNYNMLFYFMLLVSFVNFRRYRYFNKNNQK